MKRITQLGYVVSALMMLYGVFYTMPFLGVNIPSLPCSSDWDKAGLGFIGVSFFILGVFIIAVLRSVSQTQTQLDIEEEREHMKDVQYFRREIGYRAAFAGFILLRMLMIVAGVAFASFFAHLSIDLINADAGTIDLHGFHGFFILLGLEWSMRSAQAKQLKPNPKLFGKGEV